MNDRPKHPGLDALIDACLDDRLSNEEATRLSQMIEESSEARQRYWEMASVHGMIEQSMQNASLKAVTGDDFNAPSSRSVNLSRWPRLTEIAAGIVIGILSASLVWAYKVPAIDKLPRETTDLIFESFEEPSLQYSGRFPNQAGVWHGDMTVAQPGIGIEPMRGDYVARMSPTLHRKFSYVRRIVDLSTLPPAKPEMLQEIEVQASFFSSEAAIPSRYQIRLAVFSEDPEEIRPIWNDESILYDRVLRHVGKNHTSDSSREDWQKLRASIEIPSHARCLLVSFAVADVGKNSPDAEHYLDAIRIRLVETPAVAE